MTKRFAITSVLFCDFRSPDCHLRIIDLYGPGEVIPDANNRALSLFIN